MLAGWRVSAAGLITQKICIIRVLQDQRWVVLYRKLRRVLNARPHSGTTTAAAAQLGLYLWQHPCTTQQQRPPALQITGSKKLLLNEIHSNPSRAFCRARMMLLPAVLGDFRRVRRQSQLLLARGLHCSRVVCCLWCLDHGNT